MSSLEAEKLERYHFVHPKTAITISKRAEQYLFYKRLLDIVLGTLGLLVALPIISLFTILIVTESRGAPFYIQERVGKDGKLFKIIKLRSMRKDAEKDGAKWAEINDSRITKVGLFIRRTRIDELPQFLLVIKGEMSIVGPRPERPMFTNQFCKEIEGFEKRLSVKPGLTGLAQVCGGYNITPKDKLKYDVEYIQNLNVWLDLKILLKTLRVVLTGEGAR